VAICSAGYVLSGERYKALWLPQTRDRSRFVTTAVQKMLLVQELWLVSRMGKQFYVAKKELQEYHVGRCLLFEMCLKQAAFRVLSVIAFSGELFYICAHSNNFDFFNSV
jgi:hypothetical protein